MHQVRFIPARKAHVAWLSLLALLSLTASAQWDQFQGNAAHTGYTGSAIQPPNLTQIWSVDAPTYSAGPGDRSVAIVEGDVYATMLDGYGPVGPYLLSRFDGLTGDVRWQVEVSTNSHSGVSAPSVTGGRVYCHVFGHSSSDDGQPALVSFDRGSGRELSRTTHSGQWSSGSRPTVTANFVYAAGGYYGGVDAYFTHGVHRWFHDVNQQYGWIPAADSLNVYVYMGEASASPGPSTGSLFVINQGSGARWATILHPRSDGSFGSSQSVMLGGQWDALALTYNDHPARENSRTLVSFHILSRSIRWELDGEFSGNPAVANNMVAVPYDAGLQFVDQGTGDRLWAWEGGRCSGNVVLTDGFAFVNSGGSVHAIDLATRLSVWNSGGVAGSIALEDELLIISNPTGVYAYSAPEGMPDNDVVSLKLVADGPDSASLQILTAVELDQCVIESSSSLSPGSWQDFHDCSTVIEAGIPYLHPIGLEGSGMIFRVYYTATE